MKFEIIFAFDIINKLRSTNVISHDVIISLSDPTIFCAVWRKFNVIQWFDAICSRINPIPTESCTIHSYSF